MELKFDRNRNRVRQCPCGKSNKDGKFSPYKGYDRFGFCHSCGENFLPKRDRSEQTTVPISQAVSVKKTSYLRKDTLSKHLAKVQLKAAPFLDFLSRLFGREIMLQLRYQYLLGTLKSGEAIFPLIDQDSRIRSAKTITYRILKDHRSIIGLDVKRDKSRNMNWIHSMERIPGFVFDRCLFGLHLSTEFPLRPIAIVESEKTAIIASVYFPNLTWMATGGKGCLNEKLLTPLINHQIILFPDLNAFSEWSSKAQDLSDRFDIRVSSYLENIANSSQKKDGLDLADFLIRFRPEKFSNSERFGDMALNKLESINHSKETSSENLQLLIQEFDLTPLKKH